MNDAYRDKMEINDLTLLHDMFDKNSGDFKGRAEIDYPPSKPPLDGSPWADLWTIITETVSIDFKGFSPEEEKIYDNTLRQTYLTASGEHWVNTLAMPRSNAPLSACRGLAEGSKRVPDRPCDESVHVFSRILTDQWIKQREAVIQEEDRKENVKLTQLEQTVRNKEHELNKKAADLQRHLNSGADGRRK